MPVHHAVTGRHAHSACKRDAHPFLPCLKKAYRPQDQFSNSRGDASNPGFSDRCSDCGGVGSSSLDERVVWRNRQERDVSGPLLCQAWPASYWPRVLCVRALGHVRLFATPWTVAHQAPLSMRFPRQEYCSGVPFLSLGGGNLPDPGIEPMSLASPALADSLPLARSRAPPAKRFTICTPTPTHSKAWLRDRALHHTVLTLRDTKCQ